MKKTKGYMAGGKAKMSTKMMANGGMTGALKKGGKTIARGSGAARTQYFGKNG